MSRQITQLLAFNRGEVSPRALTRVDVDKLRFAAECQVNWQPSVLGAMSLRGGFGHIDSTKNDAPAKLLPFVFSKTDTAQFEFTDQLLRIRVNDALVSRVAVSTVVTNGDFGSAAGWTLDGGSGSAAITDGELRLAGGESGIAPSCLRAVSVAGGDQAKAHALRIVVVNGPVTFQVGTSSGGSELIRKQTLTTGTHSLVFTPNAATVYVKFENSRRHTVRVDSIVVEAAGTLELPTPWLAADLAKLRIEQSGDVVFVGCHGYQQRRIERRDSNSWSIVLYQAEDGPFKGLNADKTRTILAEGLYGSVWLNGTGTEFTADDVGSLIHIGESDLALTPGWKPNETLSVPTVALTSSGTTNIGDFTDMGNAWDGSGATSASRYLSPNGYIGRSYSSQQSIGIVEIDGFIDIRFGRVDLYGKIGAAPASATDGTLLGSARFGSVYAPTVINSTNTLSTWDHIWVTFIPDTPGDLAIIAELRFLTFSASELLRRWNGNVYQAIAGSNSGSVPPVHTDGDVMSEQNGMVWRYRHGSAGIARIISVTSPTRVAVDVLARLPDSVLARATSAWAMGSWNARDGWPSVPTMHEQRLWWWRGDGFWGSRSDDYHGFTRVSVTGIDYGDAGMVSGSFGSGPMDVVNWAVSALRLLIGREQTIESGRSNAFDQPIAPTAFGVKTCSTDGAARLPALKVDQRIVYVQQSDVRVFGLEYSAQAGDYVPRDLTRLNPDVGTPRFVANAAQRQPDPVLWHIRTDGQAAGLLYLPAEEIACWFRWQTQGVIEDVCILPSDDLEDRVYFVVRRIINGETKRFIEKLALREECRGGALNCQLDSYVTYSGPETSTITIPHLPLTVVSIWADDGFMGTAVTDANGVLTLPNGDSATNIVAGLGGDVVTAESAELKTTLAVDTKWNGCPAEVFADVGGTGRPVRIGTLTVANGIITLPRGLSAHVITALLGYVAPFQSAKLGQALARNKSIDQVGLVLFDTGQRGLKVGDRFDKLDALPEIVAGAEVDPGTVFPECDDATSVPGEWNRDARLCLLAQAPNPCTVGAAAVAVTTT